ncbi:HAD-IA family hydrolase [Aerophototrophica crusticola]|uniref:HAD-IA family hydrolase n=1 Tax=Aerophototrophica crusticola TaxID=1709002 RepID=A0A858R3H9_9PROT|nr:HAD-IA family hydrolase [Rhodospirillaceae bacterium B3]
MLRALIFDVDGTLAETEELHRQAFNDTFREFGLPWDWDPELYRHLLEVAGGKERMLAHAAARPPGEQAMVRAMVVEMHAWKTRRYGQLVEAGRLTYRPGVVDLLREARDAGVALAVATTTSLPNVRGLLRHTPADLPGGVVPEGWFAVLAAGDVVRAKKPAPDIYHLALAELGVDAGDAVAFEDSRNGLAAALAAGIPTLVTPSAWVRPFDAAGALAVVESLHGMRLETLRDLRTAPARAVGR